MTLTPTIPPALDADDNHHDMLDALDLQTPTDNPAEAIPILHDMVEAGDTDLPFISNANPQATSFNESLTPVPGNADIARAVADSQAASIAPTALEPNTKNPFLPKHIVEKIKTNQEESVKIMQEMARLASQPKKRRVSTRSPAYRRLEQQVHQEAENLLQEIVDEYVPIIESELHKRLKLNLPQSLEELIKQRIEEALNNQFEEGG